MSKIIYIDEVEIKNKTVLLRVDFNVSLNPNYTIADDTRIRQSIPTIKYLLERGNRLILLAHLGRPHAPDMRLSLRKVVPDLKKYLVGYRPILIEDFQKEVAVFKTQDSHEILIYENIRFHPEEEKNDPHFAKRLSKLGDVYVNDAFGVSNRSHASLVGIPRYVPSYGGLLLKREIELISKAIEKPKKPFVAIIGGAKIKTKIPLISRLVEIADHVIVGGGLANAFLFAQGFSIGKSICDTEHLNEIRKLFFLAAEKHTVIHLPTDVMVGQPDKHISHIRDVKDIPEGLQILDVGPATLAKYGALISEARTIIWNGPMGYFENPTFRQGTDFIFYAITNNPLAASIVGGGDTIAAISNKEYVNKITHVSTGGGAMLEFIEKGTLPGIEA